MRKIIFFSIVFLFYVFPAQAQVSFTFSTYTACVSSTVLASASGGTISSPSFTWIASPAGVIFSSTNTPSPVLTFTAPGNYSVIAIVVSGTVLSFQQNTITIIPNAIPLVNSTAPGNSVCPQSQFTLNVSGGPGTSFSVFTAPNITAATSPSTNVSLLAQPVLPFTYFVVTDSAGCKRTNTFTLNEKKMIVPLSLPQPSVCPGTAFTLAINGSFGTTYTVLSGPGNAVSSGTSFTHTVVAATSLPHTYTVLADSTGCTGSNTIALQPYPLHPKLSASAFSVCAGKAVTLTAHFVGSNTLAPTQYTFGTVPPLTILQSGSSSTTGANPLVPTNYTLMVDSAGCVSSTSVHVGIIPGPTVNAAASIYTTCIVTNGDGINPKLSKPLVLSASGASMYVWTPYNPNWPQTPPSITYTVRPTSTTCFTVMGTDAQGCSGTAVTCVTVIPHFNISLSPTVQSICPGDQAKFGPPALGGSLNSPFTYSWTEQDQTMISILGSNLSPTIVAVPPVSRTYYLESYDTLGCASNQETVTVNVFNCTGIAGHDGIAEEIVVYPNPTNNKITVSLAQQIPGSLNLVDLLGRLIQGKEIGGASEYNFDLGLLPAGVYYLELKTLNGSRAYKKIVKE